MHAMFSPWPPDEAGVIAYVDRFVLLSVRHAAGYQYELWHEGKEVYTFFA